MGIRENPFYGNFYAVSALANYELLICILKLLSKSASVHSKTVIQN